jgi:hypothetical protein
MVSQPTLNRLLPSADIRGGTTPLLVMAGLVPAIHVLLHGRKKDADARDKPGHDELFGSLYSIGRIFGQTLRYRDRWSPPGFSKE